MNQITSLYFETYCDEKKNSCCDVVYDEFLDFCFENYDYFMFVYMNDGNGLTQEQKKFKKQFNHFHYYLMVLSFDF